MATTIVRAQKNNHFKVISDYCCEDNRLSWKAKGLHTYVMTRPDGWQIYLADLVSRSTDGKDSVYSAMRELAQYGYMEKKQPRDENGRMTFAEYIFHEKPVAVSENPYTENPHTANPYTANPQLTNNNLNNYHTKQETGEEDTTFAFPQISKLPEENKFDAVAQALTDIFIKHGKYVPSEFVAPPRFGIGKQYTDLIFNRQWGDMLVPMTDHLLRCNPNRKSWKALDVVKAWENGLPDAWQAGEFYDYDKAMQKSKEKQDLPEFLHGDGKMNLKDFIAKCEKGDNVLQTLGSVAETMRKNYETIAEWRAWAKLELPAVKDLAAFSVKEIASAYKRLVKSGAQDWDSRRLLWQMSKSEVRV